jgi:hypothetical protein
MSATISQPTTGRKSSAAPFGAVAILAGVVAIGAIAIAYGPAIKATPVAGVPVEVQTALIQHRADERASLGTVRDPRLVVAGSELQDRFPAYVATDPRLLVNQAEIADRIAAAAIPVNPGVIMSQNLVPPTYSGNVRDGSAASTPTYHPFDPMYMAQSVNGAGATFVGKAVDDRVLGVNPLAIIVAQNEAMLAARYNSAPSWAGADQALSLAEQEALLASRYSSASSTGATQGLSLAEAEALYAARYNSLTSLEASPAFSVVAFLDAEKAAADRFAHRNAISGTGTGPQTAQQKGLVGPDRWEIMAQDKFAQQQLSRIAVPAPHVGGPARHPVAH